MQVPLSMLAGQIDAVLGDIGADVVKTGMLPSAEARMLCAATSPACPLAGLTHASQWYSWQGTSVRMLSMSKRSLGCTAHMDSYRTEEASLIWRWARALPDQVVELVAERIKAHGVAALVVDPVLVSTSGHALGDSAAARAMVARSGSAHTPHALCMQRCQQGAPSGLAPLQHNTTCRALQHRSCSRAASWWEAQQAACVNSVGPLIGSVLPVEAPHTAVREFCQHDVGSKMKGVSKFANMSLSACAACSRWPPS